MKATKLLLALALAMTSGMTEALATEVTDSTDLAQQNEEIISRLNAVEKDIQQQKVWSRRKYINLSYVTQTLTDKSKDVEYESDWGLSIVKGVTYYLHAKPIAGIMKFGIDWTKLDLNGVKYQTPQVFRRYEDYSITTYQVDYSMHVGPSLTVNPIDHLKINVYGRYAPTVSFVIHEDGSDTEGLYNYVSFFVVGGAISYKTLSVGIETRWGKSKYNSFKRSDNQDFDNIDSGDFSLDNFLIRSKSQLATHSTRAYISLRF